MLKRIHVNRHNMAANRKAGDTRLPAWTVKLGNGRNVRAVWFEIMADDQHPVNSVYDPYNPMKCGAVAWLETRATVFVRRPDGENERLD